MQFDPIYARRTSLLRAAPIIVYSSSGKFVMTLISSTKRTGRKQCTRSIELASGHRAESLVLTRVAVFFFILAQVAIFDRVKFNY